MLKDYLDLENGQKFTPKRGNTIFQLLNAHGLHYPQNRDYLPVAQPVGQLANKYNKLIPQSSFKEIQVR